MTAQSFKGHDYRRGMDVELPRSAWRERIEGAQYTRRVGRDLLGFERDRIDGRVRLAFEIYDDGELSVPRKREQ
jgi:hypothetical protein